MKKILITGLTGTSGTAFYKVLCREKYDKPIKVLVREKTNVEMFKNSPLDIELCIGDLNDEESLKRAIKGCDMVFHIAAKGLTRKLVNTITSHNEKIDVILVSSTIVYSQYYKTSYLKQDEEDYIRELSKAKLKYVFIRPTMIFGTDNDRNISKFIEWFDKFRVFPIVKQGRATIQPVHREDLAEGYWLILKNFGNLKYKDYVISGERSMTLQEMFQIITRSLGKQVCFINIPFELAKIMVSLAYICSFEKIDYREKLDRLTEDRAYSHKDISEELGYKPISFEKRVQKMITTYYR